VEEMKEDGGGRWRKRREKEAEDGVEGVSG